MPQAVCQPADTGLRLIGDILFGLVAELRGGFADDEELALDAVAPHALGAPLLLVAAFQVIGDGRAGIDDILITRAGPLGRHRSKHLRLAAREIGTNLWFQRRPVDQIHRAAKQLFQVLLDADQIEKR